MRGLGSAAGLGFVISCVLWSCSTSDSGGPCEEEDGCGGTGGSTSGTGGSTSGTGGSNSGSGGSGGNGGSGGGGYQPQAWSVEVPSDCAVRGLGASVSGSLQRGEDDTCASTLSVQVSADGEVTAVDGESCTYTGGGLKAPERDSCRQFFECGGCEYEVSVETSFLDDSETWTIAPNSADCGAQRNCDYDLGAYSGGGGTGGSGGGGNTCSPRCGANEFCSNGQCMCPSGCLEGTVCCGGSRCAGNCLGSPCCR